jgi:4-phytase/acid phosphatase
MRLINRIAWAYLLAGAFATPVLLAQHDDEPTTPAKIDSGSDLLKVIVISRHGIRAPLQTQTELAQYSSGVWPEWSVPPGDLTVHGSQTMKALGRFYAEYYAQDGLFAGAGCTRIHDSFAWSDVDERDIATARSFFDGLAPNCNIAIHTVPKGEVDPYQHPLKAHLGHPDRALALAAVQGRIGGDAASVLEANLPAFRALDRILGGCVTAHCPAGKGTHVPLYSMPATIQIADDDDHFIAESTGPLGLASTLTETLQLEYAEGKPMNQVGFGRISRADLTQILSLHSLYFDLANETPYIAQVQASNLMNYLRGTLDRATASGGPSPSSPLASGSDAARFVFIASHDTNIASIAGFLRAEWYVPGAQKNPTLPGGALVFELRRRRTDGSLWVCTKYISETLDQLRENATLSPQTPPAIVPVFIPACSIATAGYDCPWPAFRDAVNANQLPEFTTP